MSQVWDAIRDNLCDGLHFTLDGVEYKVSQRNYGWKIVSWEPFKIYTHGSHLPPTGDLVIHNPPQWSTGQVPTDPHQNYDVYRFHTEAEAEEWIEQRAKIDPEGVHRGDYFLDGPADDD